MHPFILLGAMFLLALLTSDITIHTSKHIFTMNSFNILGWIILAVIASIVVVKIIRVICRLVGAICLTIAAEKWRKKARIGDRAKFRNAMNGWTCGVITHFYGEGVEREARIDYQGHCSRGSVLVPLYDLFPDM